MLAVIKTGGKQYLVTPGQKIKIEKLGEKGSEVAFDEVLLLEKSNKLAIGTPLVEGAKVTGKVLRRAKDKKVIIFKYKAKKRYQVKKGHRQPFSEVAITKIS
ncbi:MAG: 50S ribosomal protein L21 [Candidatus Nealsonbacteria bacterium RIFCSPLOWO2_01_FULL_43_32]|uniref:Large ribosomal subunit protein bL21 n=1 Tax=Candidatus Nealsonbacteria bacterium RIFCSPLOWO2_01_FULL_43_32 TaxID=1801672 RepID=A0A1G2EG94_9BACT|nr:MAG: 50S ribosomal protein L21 [Candidatus Nealsonbacteria bacterium RIFCSPLOWO2_01_FULL_43_32]